MFYATQDGSKLDPSLVERVFKSIEKVIEGLEEVIDDDTNKSFGKKSNCISHKYNYGCYI
jgi:hypothetical protein